MCMFQPLIFQGVYQREMFEKGFTVYIPAENYENSESITKVLALEIWTCTLKNDGCTAISFW